jgi:hypothetical protein
MLPFMEISLDSQFIVGIDLGTTNSAMAHSSISTVEDSGGIELENIPQLVNPNEVADRTLLPSSLYIPGELEGSCSVHRDQPGHNEPGGGALLQQAKHGGAMDQRRKAGSEDDAAELSSFPLKRGAAGLSVLAYNLWNLWRRLALPNRIENRSLTRLQQRLVKTSERLVNHARYFWLLLAEGHLNRRRFGAMLGRIALCRYGRDRGDR